MAETVVGRDALLDDIWRSLGAADPVLLEGPAGIGKSALFRTLVARARADGMLVVGCAPTEAETSLPLAAVADVLAPLAAAASELPDPQRRAVEAALSGESGVDERGLAAGTHTLLERLAMGAIGEQPALLAIDDAPWLDAASERALRFALRRLSAPLPLLVTMRTSDVPAEPPLGLAAAPALRRMTVPPLGVGPLHHVLRERLGATFARPLVSRLARDSGGNALLAIELGRAVLRLPELPGPADDLPPVSSMQELVAATLSGLDEASRQAVRLAALLSAPTAAVVQAAGAASTDLDAAEEAGLLVVRPDDRIAFAHPVYAAAVRAGIPGGVRRRLHARLAAVSRDPDERARQLSRSTSGPDDAVAAELVAAAERARSRGAPELAADFYDRAGQLSTNDAQRLERRLTAVRCRYDSGDYVTAGTQAAAIAETVVGAPRADALLLRAAIAWSADDPFVAIDAATRALAEAGADTPLAGRIHAHLGVFVDLPGPARAHAETALRLLDGVPGADRPSSASTLLAGSDSSLLASVLMLLFLNEVRSGRPARPELLDRALRLEGAEPSWLAGTVPAIWWKATDDRDRAVERLTWMLSRADAMGEEPFQHEIIAHLGEAELLAGRFAAAERWIAQARELGEQLGTGTAAETWLAGLLNAHRGNLGAAEAAATAGLRTAAETGEPWLRRINLQLAGFTALAAGRPVAAAAHYAALAEAVDGDGLVEPLGTRLEPDWVEAAAGAGDIAAAETARERLAARHERLPRPWTTLGLARADVLLAAAGGRRTDDALDALLVAHAATPADVVPFERARCLLVAGRTQRRARRKAAARELLDRAAADFDALGAAAHAAAARSEAGRIGGRPAAPTELTATEASVARLAAVGRTNRAIADELFVSPKTVEANLARIYRKLGITGRAELGVALVDR